MRRAVHYVGLDLLRFAAASLVVADHFGAYGWATPTTAATGDALAFPFLWPMEDIGSIGIEIFFLISGFVIAASAVGASAGAFAVKRAIRVFPALWLCGLVALAARASAGEPLPALAAAFLRSAVLSPLGPYVDGVVWTLVVEAVFYALVFVVLLRDGFGRMERVALALGCVSAAFLSLFVVATWLAPASPRWASVAMLCGRFPCKLLLLRHGVFFALGMLLWRGFDARFTPRRLAAMAGFALFCSAEIVFERGGWRHVAVALALWWGALGAIVASVAWAEPLHRAAGRLAGLVGGMGRLSYPLYLNHYVLGMVLVPALAGAGLGRPAVLLAALALVVGSSVFIMRYPERLAQCWLRARLARAGRPDATGSPATARPAAA